MGFEITFNHLGKNIALYLRGIIKEQYISKF
jgi:hypothetical protein